MMLEAIVIVAAAFVVGLLGILLWEVGRVLEAIGRQEVVLTLAVNRHETESILTLRDQAMYTRRASEEERAEGGECGCCEIPLAEVAAVWLDPRAPGVGCCSTQCLQVLQGKWRLQELAHAQLRMRWRLQGARPEDLDQADKGALLPWWERGEEYRPQDEVFNVG